MTAELSFILPSETSRSHCMDKERSAGRPRKSTLLESRLPAFKKDWTGSQNLPGRISLCPSSQEVRKRVEQPVNTEILPHSGGGTQKAFRAFIKNWVPHFWPFLPEVGTTDASAGRVALLRSTSD